MIGGYSLISSRFNVDYPDVIRKLNTAMKATAATIILLILTLLEVSGQTVTTNLNGFRLGQYRATAKNEFGKPFKQGKFEDGFEYEAFHVKPNTDLYMVFEYAAGRTNVIWSIQISGSNTTTDIGFKDLKLGLDKKEIQRVLGKPDNIENIGDYGEKWSYNKTNYSVEVSKSGKLSSVKITDDYSGKAPDVSRLPKFGTIVKVLSSKNNASIASVLAPGIEIYCKGQKLFFKKSLKTEIGTDYSKIFKTIKEISNELGKVNISDEKSYEEDMRIALGQNTKYVIKIKKGNLVKEIVFEYINEKYLIWEISAQ